MKLYIVHTSRNETLKEIGIPKWAVRNKTHGRIELKNAQLGLLKGKKKWKLYEVTINVKQID